MASVIDILLSLKARSEQVAAATRQVQQLRSAFGSVAGFAATFTGVNLSIQGMVSMLGNAARSAFALADRVSDLSEQYRISTGAIQTLELAARDGGTTFAAVGGVLERINVKLDEAAAGSTQATSSFSSLGLVVDELRRMSPEGRIEAFGRALTRAGTDASALAAAADIAGGSSQKLFAVLERLGTEGLGNLEQSFADAGRVLDEEFIKRLDRAGETFQKLWDKTVVISGEALMDLQAAFEGKSLEGPLKSAWPVQLTRAQMAMWRGAAGMFGPSDEQQQRIAALRAQLAAPGQSAAVAEAETEAARAARARATAEQDAAAWLKTNEERLRGAIRTLQIAALSDEVRLAFLREQRAEMDRAAETALAAAAGEKSRLQVQLQAEEQRLRITREIESLERSITERRLAQTRRTLEDNARIGAPELMIETGRAGTATGDAGAEAAVTTIWEQLSDLQAEWSNLSQQWSQTVSGSMREGIDSFSDGITAALFRTRELDEAMMGVAQSVGVTLVQAIIRMGAQWIASQLLQAAVGKKVAAASLAATAAESTATSALWATPAALANIATLGAAAAQAPFSIAGALASVKALSLLSNVTPVAAGGPYSAGRPYLMGEYGPELVIPHESGIVVNHRETAAIAGALASRGGSASGAGGPGSFVFVDSRRQAESIRRASSAETQIVDVVRANRYRIFAGAGHP